MLVVLSMTMATQYVSTKVGFSYSIVSPSNADIRFIASDNSSDGYKVLRINNNATFNIQLIFGNWSQRTNKTYTAAFCIVNEEKFKVNITSINVTTVPTNRDYMQIWLHGNRSYIVGDETSPSAKAYVWNKGPRNFGSTSCVWQLGAGNGNPADMSADGITQIGTGWDPVNNTHIRYSLSNTPAVNRTSDFVWVQISLNIPDGATLGGISGSIWLNFRATTSGL